MSLNHGTEYIPYRIKILALFTCLESIYGNFTAYLGKFLF